MSLIRCRYCERDNPPDSKFCSECGGALHLVPCPRCGAVSQITATVCYQCGGPLQGQSADGGQLPEPRAEAPFSSSPVAEVSTSFPRRPTRVVVGTAVLAAVFVLGYYAYRQRSHADAPQPPAAMSEGGAREAPADAGSLDGDAAPGDAQSASADDGAGPADSATSPLGSAPAEPVRATASQARAGRQPVKSQEAKADEPALLHPEACTEAAAALGLCATESVQKKEAETAAVEAAMKRPPTGGAGNTGAQEPPRSKTCTEGVAALGLCTPKPTQRRE